MVWEYTDNATGDADTAKEEASKKVPVKRGQVCSVSLLVLPSIFNSVIKCGAYELISPLFFPQPP